MICNNCQHEYDGSLVCCPECGADHSGLEHEYAEDEYNEDESDSNN